ncbi:MAG: hypothetical protein NUV77_18190 [Thermoguttaceae bacterium]|jgi:hypothetical protein|nr:hypothetical protein [Thermoguttaceae bacterium]
MYSSPQVMNENKQDEQEIEILSAVDAIRCLYLARELQRKGDLQAARRWEAAAQRWLQLMGYPAQEACPHGSCPRDSGTQ